MEVRHWKDASGAQFREITSSDLVKLEEMKNEYEKRGATAWIIPSRADSKYILTIKET